MTDKEQIIIHGVDVSECLFYQINFEEDYDVKIEHFCSNWHNSCESSNNSNCYFKQLARKTQEFEQLQEKYEALKLENQEGYEIVAELKQECEELKEQLQANQPTGICETCMAKAILQNDKYCKALEEIEGLVKNFCKDCDDYEDCNWDKEGCYYSLIPNLKDIINKTKGTDNE